MNCNPPASLSPDSATLAEYDAIEQLVEDNELCSVDGEPHSIEEVRESYGEDRDGNRGTWYYLKRCRKCGEEW